MTLRRLRVLVEQLPPESRTMRKLRGDPWGPVEHLLADVYDAIMNAGVMVARSNQAKVKKPKPHPRPGEDRDKGKIGKLGKYTQEQALAFIQSRKPVPAS